MNAPGIPEILFILVVALLIFGPRKLPELGKSLGAGLREFRRSTQGLKEEFEGAMNDTRPQAQAAPVSAPQTQVIAAQPQVISAQAAAVSAQPVPEPVAAAEAVPAAPTRQD